MESIILIMWLFSCINMGCCLGLLKSKEYLKNLWLKDEEKILELEIRINKVREIIFDNYGILDKYGIEMLDNILKGESND